MTRPVSEHFGPDGKTKRCYPSKATAALAADRIGAWPYRCEFCGRWHIGHARVPARS